MKRNLLTTLICCLGLSSGLIAQDFTVKGLVISAAERTPLEGVTVVLKGTKEITETNKKGRYEIKVKPNFFGSSTTDTLLFTFEGFDPFEVALNGQNRVDIAMRGDAPSRKDIIYSGTAAGRAPLIMTYSAGKLEEDMIHAAPNPQLGTFLQGKIPGLKVRPISGEPGQSPYFQLRGANNLANGQQPLILLDGVYLNGSSLADINLEDI
ncbi:MAG: carboxypeptidase-like regulatory domain-containing protein, partial [Bacteroidota bacterium]